MRIILFSAFIFLVSCHHSPGYLKLKYQEQQMPSPSTDVRLPTKMWNLFDNSEGMEAKADTTEQKPTEFIPLRVYVYERNKGILGGQNYRFEFPAGGGELDLKDFVSDRSGSYYFAAEPEFKGDESNLRIYFLSNSTERSLNNHNFGSGCDKYFDITTAFKKAMSTDGFLLNTTAQRDVSALAGTFFFVIDDGVKLHIARLTVKDSRYPSLQCNR